MVQTERKAAPLSAKAFSAPPYNTPQAKCDVHRIDVNAINSEKATIAVYRILGICDVHRI